MDKVLKVLRGIENMEDSWKYELTDSENKKHSYARTREDGNSVRLWSVPQTTGKLLNFLVSAKQPKKILEMGCSAGYSTIWMALGIKDIGGHIFTTEILPIKIKLLKKNFKEADLMDYITILEDQNIDVLKNWNKGKVDMIFLDADAKNYTLYAMHIDNILNKNGILIVDNINTHRILMQDFLENIKQSKIYNCVTLEMDNGLLLAYKTR